MKIQASESNEEQAEDSYKSRYKKNKPADRFICCREGDFLIIMDRIGPGLDYWAEEVDLSPHYLGMPPTDGFYFWVGGVRTFELWTDYGYDYDSKLDGEFIKVTKEDFESYDINGSWWDSSLWLKDTET